MLSLWTKHSPIGEIDPQQERIIELRFFAGLSIEETAKP